MFRAARPTDLPGLLRFAAQAVPNWAYPRRRLGDEARTAWALPALLTPWVPRHWAVHALLLTRGPRRGALVALRGRRDLAAWEMDQLLLTPASADLCAELLARLEALLVQVRAERVFVRLAEESPLLESAREAGYRPYVTERLYHDRRLAPAGGRGPAMAPGLEARPRRAEDDYPLFRLYSAATPVSVRVAEGLTFREWQETSAARWQGEAREVVVFQAGSPLAWARLAPGASRRSVATVLAHPQEPQAGRAALQAAIQGAEPCFLVPDHATALEGSLQEAGFIPGQSYVSLVHQVGARLMEPAFMPARI